MTTNQTLDLLYRNQESPKTMQQVYDSLLGLTLKKQEEDKFKGTFSIPKGTKKPFSHYIDEDGIVNIPPNELFVLDIQPNDIFKGIYMSGSGTHKSWQMKNDLFYFYHNDFNCGVIDTKNVNMIQCKFKPDHNATRLHPGPTPGPQHILVP